VGNEVGSRNAESGLGKKAEGEKVRLENPAHPVGMTDRILRWNWTASGKFFSS
jgi:hypothetical protein